MHLPEPGQSGKKQEFPTLIDSSRIRMPAACQLMDGSFRVGGFEDVGAQPPLRTPAPRGNSRSHSRPVSGLANRACRFPWDIPAFIRRRRPQWRLPSRTCDPLTVASPCGGQRQIKAPIDAIWWRDRRLTTESRNIPWEGGTPRFASPDTGPRARTEFPRGGGRPERRLSADILESPTRKLPSINLHAAGMRIRELSMRVGKFLFLAGLAGSANAYAQAGSDILTDEVVVTASRF